jgi:hypothetical protein
LAARVADPRARAVARASARVPIDSTGSVRIEAPIGAGPGAASPPLNALVHADGAAGPVAIEFDARGVGIVASRTFRVRRGAAEARLTLSAFGRPRRW